MKIMMITTVLFAFIFSYFFPAIIAYVKNLPNKHRIFKLNLLLGWTIIGWIIALAKAVDEE